MHDTAGSCGSVGLLERSLSEALALVPACPPAEGPWSQPLARRARPRIEALVAAYLAFFDEHRDLYVAAELGHLEGKGTKEGLAPLLEAGARAILPIVTEALAEAGAVGRTDALPDPWESALALWAMLDAVLIAAVKRGGDYRGADHALVAARAVEYMLEGIARGEGGEART